MAKIKGTNGNDTLVGTAGDDFLFTLRGKDNVDGGAGHDVLTIDWSGVASSDVPSGIALGSDGAWTGSFFSGSPDARNSVILKNVERVVYTGLQADDLMSVSLGTLPLDKSRLSLDAGVGQDSLTIRADKTDPSAALLLTVADGGKITTNVGALSGWDTFDIALGTALGNKLTLGAGNDIARSSGGRDAIDMGAGFDSWVANYTGRRDALTLSWSATAGASAKAGTATLASVTNVEVINAFLGAGNDLVNLWNGPGFVDGGTGDNTLTLHAGTAAPRTVYVYVDALELRGEVTDAGGGTMQWKNFRTATLAGSAGDDQFTLSAASTVINSKNYAYSFDAGAGTDSILLDLRGQLRSFLSATGEGLGSARLTFQFQNNVVDLQGFERVSVYFGANDDQIESGIALHTFVDGGGGLDTISFAGAASAIQIELAVHSAQTVGLGAQDYALYNVEGVIGSAFADRIYDSADGNLIRAGGGDDLVLSIAASTTGADLFDGGAGVRDRMDYQLAASAVAVNLAITGAQSTGGGGVDTLTGFEDLGGSSYGDTLTGNTGDNRLYGNYGDDVLEGATGDDYLDGGVGTDTASFAHAAAAVTVSLATAASQTTGVGSDTLVGIENLTGSAHDDTLTGSGGANVITGGLGTDIMTGNGGADRFVFRSAAETSTEFLRSDLITDFVGPGRGAGDIIDVSGIDANRLTFRFNEAFSFIGTAAFSGVAGQLHVVNEGGGLFLVEGDTNGDKTADFAIYVQSTDTALGQGDFVL